MAINKENLVGHVECSTVRRGVVCGRKSEVGQTKKPGRYLYSYCPACGLDQRTGETVQSELWEKTKFFTGLAVVRPANVAENSEPAPINEPNRASEPRAESGELAGEFDPDAIDDSTENDRTESRGGVLVPLGIVVVGIVGAFFS